MELQLTLIVCQRGGKLARPMDATAIDDHDDLFAGFAKDTHDLREILTEFLGVKMRHNLIEDARRAILDRPDNAEQDATGDAAPGAILRPRLALEAFFAFDVALAQGTDGQTRALGATPPAQPGQGKAPQDRFVFIAQNDLTPACPVLQGGKGKRARGEISRCGIEPSSGTAGA